MTDLGTFFLDPLIRVLLDPAVSCAENSCGNIMQQQLLVDHVHNCWDYLLDVFLSFYQSHHIVCSDLLLMVWTVTRGCSYGSIYLRQTQEIAASIVP